MSAYGIAPKLLHYLALGLNAVTVTSFDMERRMMLSGAPNSRDGAHVFVAGYARAGTTFLMRTLYQSNDFCSLTYKDMPFVLAPNLWSIITSRFHRQITMAERAHKDGILVDAESPEALEEVFWRVQTEGRYIGKDALTVIDIDNKVTDLFRMYVSLVLKRYGKVRYLSKNNNNILRIPAILQTFPKAFVVIPFRDPVQHANSLLNKHNDFILQYEKDGFAKAYMTWLAHHEFGVTHRPFVWPQTKPSLFPTSELSYWLENWCHAYAYLLSVGNAHPDRILFFDYDRFCAEGDTYLAKVTEVIGIKKTGACEIRNPHRHPTSVDLDPALRESADNIHGKLKTFSTV